MPPGKRPPDQKSVQSLANNGNIESAPAKKSKLYSILTIVSVVILIIVAIVVLA